MNEYAREKFEDAIYTDLNIYTDESDAMIALFIFEDEMEDINNAIAQVAGDEGVKVDLMNALRFALGGV